jgi:signal transduction histidine kinase
MAQRIIGEDIALRTRLLDSSLVVRGDVGMLEQVLMNLVVNARDAMPGGGRLEVSTQYMSLSENDVSTKADLAPGAYACIDVADTGSGISPEALTHIFEPFFTTKAVGKGTGLGLATAFGIVKQHQGSIQVESTVGQGTTFRILLPLTTDAVDVAAADHAAERRGGDETILLVEDDPSVRLMTRTALDRQG